MIDVADKQRQGLHPDLAKLLESDDTDKHDYVFCAACSNVLGQQRDAIEVGGVHEHWCTNPYGFSFHIGCFSAAPGCSISGAPNAADSWFAGYTWRLASCSSCQQHIGWLFEASGHTDSFFGLILDRSQTD